MGDDIAALLNYLEIPRADLVGHSFGGASAIRAGIRHPDKVRRLVVISSPYAKSGWYPEEQKGMSQISASMAENMMQTPTGKIIEAMARAAALGNTIYGIANIVIETASRTVAQNVNIIREALPKP